MNAKLEDGRLLDKIYQKDTMSLGSLTQKLLPLIK